MSTTTKKTTTEEEKTGTATGTTATGTGTATGTTDTASGLYAAERKKAIDNKLQYYNTQESALDQSQKSQQEMASITLDKLQKYLPYQLKAQGISNSGASESAMLQAHTNYMNTMSDIAANTNAEKTNLEMYKQQDIDAINEKYDQKVAAESSDNLLLLNEKVTDLIVKYQDENGMLSSEEKAEIEKYIEDNAGLLTEGDKLKLYMTLDGHTATDETAQETIDAAQAKLDNSGDIVKLKGASNTANDKRGDNFEVNIGEQVYKVEKGFDITDENTAKEINNAYGGTPAVGSSVVHNGKLYMFLENNNTGSAKWCLVQGRANDDSSFNNLCQALGIKAYQRNTWEEEQEKIGHELADVTKKEVKHLYNILTDPKTTALIQEWAKTQTKTY